MLLLLLLCKMVKKRGISKKKKSSEKEIVLKGKKADKKINSDKQKKSMSHPVKKEKVIKKGKNLKQKKIREKKKEFLIDKKYSTKRLEKVVKNLKKGFSEKELQKQEKEKTKKPDEKFMQTGIKGFDELFEKGMGIPNGKAVLVEGGPGSGKTVFCLATTNKLCKRGRKCLYMSFEESEDQLVDHMETFGWNAKEYVKKGLLRISRFDAIDISRSIEALLSAAKKELLIDIEPMFFPDDFEPDFVVIDSLTSIASAFSGEESRFRIYMEQLFRYLEKNKITNFLIREVSSPSHVGTTFKEQGEAVSFLSDGIVIIYNVIYDSGERASAIEILKMRGASFKKRIVEMKIMNKKGVEVNPNKILKKSRKSNFSLT
ncbi:hypothetical protein AUJ63_02470 [Candidatus Pacearchaeota archaeon CG1_02_35_32]|nr:MAG: hypothetical protein AUJ63_02470 [Candidatus Pacearchaeota archaeon CG1_02_35_32]